MNSPQVAIVGGGISGLSTAYFLSRFGIRSTIIEKSARLGGLIKTEFLEECRLEAGPDSYLAAKTSVTELAHELGELGNQIVGSNDERRRIYIVRDGKLVALPRGMVMIAPSQWLPALRSNLFSGETKLRFLKETWTSPREREQDVSVSDFVRSHFGREVLEYVAEPLLSGVYGGDPDKLSARSVLPSFLSYERKYGSLIKGVRRERRGVQTGSIFLSFAGGMQGLTEALTQAITGRAEILQAEVSEIERASNCWRIHAGDSSLEAQHIVLACPAHVSAKLLESCSPSLGQELAGIPYSSAILVTLVYERDGLGHPLDGFGFLVPRPERRIISAATWVSTKFPSRTPERFAALRGFIVDPQAEELLRASSSDIARLVAGEFERLMGIRSQPRFSHVQFWPKSMPQYTVGHEQRMRRTADFAAELPGLYLAGNLFTGVGIPDCVHSAKETAKRIAESTQQRDSLAFATPIRPVRS